MKSKNNGKPEQCAANLLSITRGEVPYERLKGISAEIIDSPSSTANRIVRADIEWLLETYEPRVNTNSIDVEGILINDGQFKLNVDIEVNEGGAA